jgi:hypothetical protein
MNTVDSESTNPLEENFLKNEQSHESNISNILVFYVNGVEVFTFIIFNLQLYIQRLFIIMNLLSFIKVTSMKFYNYFILY